MKIVGCTTAAALIGLLLWLPPAAAQDDQCNGVTFEGCCDGTVVTWCENGFLLKLDCSKNKPPKNTCGWNPDANLYDCGYTGDDTSGVHPGCCPGVEASCEGKACGTDGCAGQCGECGEGKFCGQDFQCQECTCADKECGKDECGNDCGECAEGSHCVDNKCEPCTCDGRQCGDDGCNNPCGTCTDGKACNKEGQCVEAPTECVPKDTPGCPGCGCEQCVCAVDDVCCDTQNGAWNIFCVGECEAYCGGPTCSELCIPDCTDKECGDDGCGGTCGTCSEGQVCTSDGTCCVPNCDGKQCGDDGCGGTCGECGENQYCGDDHVCHDCSCEGKQCGTDECGNSCGECGENQYCGDDHVCHDCSCEGKQCGDDGCGNPCGTCDEGLVCNDAGHCVQGGCFGVSWEGCCKDNVVYFCYNDELQSDDCGANDAQCGWSADNSFYACGGEGEDPSGNNPIACPCIPDCSQAECGDGGCPDYPDACGTCDQGYTCQDGQCVQQACEPDCEGKECGDGGCPDQPNACGICADGYTCQEGKCVLPPCEPDCEGKECGDGGCPDQPDACGTCEGGYTCQEGKCVTIQAEPTPDAQVGQDVAGPDAAADAVVGQDVVADQAKKGGGGGGGCSATGAANPFGVWSLLLGLGTAFGLTRRRFF